jgi:hypothetical protein
MEQDDSHEKRPLPEEVLNLGDAPIEPQYVEQMAAIAHVLDEFFNGELREQARTTGFVLLVFPFGEKAGRCNYISNGADRRDIIVLMKEQIARFEGMPGGEGHG